MTRWTRSFMEEVVGSLQRLGITACPVCGSEEALGIGRRPVLIVDGEFPPPVGGVPFEADPDRQVTFGVQIECTSCGYLMMFNAERHRTGDDPILVTGDVEEEE
jgi:hypothetical protein